MRSLESLAKNVFGKKNQEMQDLDDAPLEVETADGNQGEVYTARDKQQATSASARALTQAPSNYTIPKTKGSKPPPPRPGGGPLLSPAPAPARQRCVRPLKPPRHVSGPRSLPRTVTGQASSWTDKSPTSSTSSRMAAATGRRKDVGVLRAAASKPRRPAPPPPRNGTVRRSI